MDIKRIRYFVALAETLHFGRAAARLHLAQPALSQQIKQLETELGIVLFDRDRRNVRLSQAGALFLSEAQSLLAHFERTRRVIERIRRAELGSISVGYAGTIAYSGLIDQSVRMLHEQSPDAQIVSHELDLAGQIEALAVGSIDVAFTRLPVGDPRIALDITPIWHESVFLAMSNEHPLAACSHISMASLAAERFVSTDLGEGLGFFHTQSQICREAGFAPIIVARLKHFATVLSLVAKREGVALVPASIRNLSFEGVVFRPIDVPQRSTVAAVVRSEPLSPMLQRYLAICRRVGEELDREKAVGA